MHLFAFEKLELWQESRKLALNIYNISSCFPESEKYGLTSQIRRASISICSNIAEGTAGTTMKQQARYSTLAYGSAIELLNQLILALDLNYVNKGDYSSLRQHLRSITNMINSLRNYQLSKLNDISSNN